MRAGTQTLIQALQALPWMNNENDEDGPPDPCSADESEDDERPTGETSLSLFVPIAEIVQFNVSRPLSTPSTVPWPDRIG